MRPESYSRFADLVCDWHSASVHRLAVFGGSRRGKSNALKTILSELLKRRDCVVVDVDNQYGAPPGIDVSVFSAYAEIPEELPQGLVLLRGADFDKHSPVFERVLERLINDGRKGRVRTLLIDEAKWFFGLNQPVTDAWSQLFTRAFQNGVQLIGSTQRPAQIATEFRSNVQAVLTFGLGGAQDREAVAKMEMPDEFERELSGLPRGSSLWWLQG